MAHPRNIKKKNEGIVLIAAAGNITPLVPEPNIRYPARFSSTISVGAVDNNHLRASFSCYGSALDLVAPGVNIASLRCNNLYMCGSGTSAACPIVAGVAALILSAKPNLTPDQVKDVLIHSCSNYPNKDQYYGYGLVDAFEAVNYAINNY